MGTFFLKSNQQAVQGIPMGKLNNHEIRIKALEDGGGGSSTFTGLSDTPSSYSGEGSKVVRVNAGRNRTRICNTSWWWRRPNN